MTGYKWKPIEDLPDDWQKLASSELAGLFAVWKEHVVTLKDSPAYLEFQTRLRREWAIETGIIEGLYDIDRGVTRTLIERGLHASLIAHGDANKPAEEIIPMLKDHEAVVEGLFDFVGQKRELSTSYIKQIHQSLTTHQETATGIDSFGQRAQIPLLQGDWKKWPNNPTRPDGLVHEYCPPEQVASEMDRLIEMHQRHLQEGVPPEVEAAWLHHRFAQIHPFQDGNGRVARALASLILIREGWFPFVVHRDDRGEYIDCLEQADLGNLSSLVHLFGRTQKKAFNQAIGLSESVLLETDPIKQVISAAEERLRTRKELSPDTIRFVNQLAESVEMRLLQISIDLEEALRRADEDYSATVENSLAGYSYKFDSATNLIAEELSYNADISRFSRWWSLTIREETQTAIVFSFHSVKPTTTELIAVSAWIESRNVEDGLIDPPKRICKEVFQFSLREEESAIIQRFSRWLDDSLLIGLNTWRKNL